MKNVCMLVSFLLLLSCSNRKNEVIGYAPVYGDLSEIKSVSLAPAQALENGGKIYVWGDLLYQVETGKGIHITDISDPAAPVQKGFIKVNGAQEVAVKNGLIYTNSQNDLVILKVEQDKLQIVKRLPEAFGQLPAMALPPERGPFECPDRSKGVVTGWQKKTLINPTCTY
ncbi:hypothetical protein [Niabella sp.]|uniref:hypothetical protein n=1 Tax=Niabella sp. TaxID=1962976 RepID=UPI002606DF42|nr:hypothetical protein [Niabella sp.]